MRWPSRASLLAGGLICCLPSVARAGMPSFTLTDAARMRVQTMSFFLIGLLLSAGFVKLLWNYLGKDWPVLPRLSYGKALAVVGLWGLLFVLVLTMISGARELMTPGAWKKDGATYKLADEAGDVDSDTRLERRVKLDGLRVALWKYADQHDGKFPEETGSAGIPQEQWYMPGPMHLRFLYIPGRSAGQGALPLVFEPEVFGPERLVLLTNGVIRAMRTTEIDKALAGEKR